MGRKGWLAWSLALAVPAAFDAQAETLQDALIFTYETSPTLSAARHNLRAEDELVPQALANWRPTVRVTADVGHAGISSNVVLPRRQSLQPRDYGVTVTEPLYRGGQTVAQTRQAEAEVGAARAQLSATEQSVLLTGATAYLDLLQATTELALQHDNERVLQHHFDSVNAQIGIGTITATDASQARSALLGARAAVLQAQGAFDAAAATYLAVIGHPAGALADPGLPADLPASQTLAIRQANDANPAVIAQKFAIEAADHGIELAQGAFLPQLSVQGDVTRALDETDFRSSVIATQVMLNLSVPIYQQGLDYSKLRQQKVIAGERRQQLEAARRQAIGLASAAWAGLTAARGQIASLVEQVKAGEAALDGRQKQFAVGASTELDILLTQQAVVTAKANLAQARHDFALAAFRLKAAMGEMTAQALGLPVPYYNAADHYREVRDSWFGTGEAPAP